MQSSLIRSAIFSRHLWKEIQIGFRREERLAMWYENRCEAYRDASPAFESLLRLNRRCESPRIYCDYY